MNLNRTLLVAFSASTLLIQSCIGNENQKESQNSGTSENEKTSMIDDGKGGMGKDSAAGIMRYSMKDKDMSTWGQLLSVSSWAKEIESQQVTFLCPQDKIFVNGTRTLIAELKRPENKSLLDRIMAEHILKEHYSIEKLFVQEEVETIDGRKLKIDKDSKTINGIHITGQETLTGGGTIITIEDVLEYPEIELKASAGKHMNKGSK